MCSEVHVKDDWSPFTLSSVSATAGSAAGNEFLEIRVGQSSVLEFQGRSGNDALVHAIFSLRNKTKSQELNKACKESGGGSHVL